MNKRIVALILIVITGFFGYFSFVHGSSARATDTRVVTVHVDGEERVLATNADTVSEVLQSLEAPLGEHDKTEPALDAPVVGGEFSINVYRARPISVVDGANSYTVMTAERTPRLIAEEAGFTTTQEDEFTFERSDDPFEETPGTELTIRRAKNIAFDLYGTTSNTKTNETTVEEFLRSKNITLEPGDELNVAQATRITEGMLISLAQVERNVETVEEVAAFPEEQIKDAQQPISYKKIQTPGVNGKKLVTYELVSRNGGTPERIAIKEVITQAPVTQVVVIGAKQIVNVGGNCGEWMAQAGITDPDAVWLIGKESGCNPGAVNRSSGACGIPQALPCSKLPCTLDANGAVCQLRWMQSYVMGRYGSWAAARSFHASRGWY